MKDIHVMIDDVKFNFRVGLIIEKRGKLLVEVSPECSHVVIPGGRVQTLEYTKDTVIREMKEEMGITLKREEFKLHDVMENFFESDGIKYHELFYIYKLKSTSVDKRFNNVKMNKDSKGNYYKWVSKDKLKEADLLPKVLIDLVKERSFKNSENNDIKRKYSYE